MSFYRLVTNQWQRKEGIETLNQFKPDIILADLMMEHYDSGFVFCKKYNRDGGTLSVHLETSGNFIVRSPSLTKPGRHLL
jgi:CheY-like chemotaxis protein